MGLETEIVMHITTQEEQITENKVQLFATRQQAERAAASVNHYLQEQEMYLAVDVVYTADGWAVAVVTCY